MCWVLQVKVFHHSCVQVQMGILQVDSMPMSGALANNAAKKLGGGGLRLGSGTRLGAGHGGGDCCHTSFLTTPGGNVGVTFDPPPGGVVLDGGQCHSKPPNEPGGRKRTFSTPIYLGRTQPGHKTDPQWGFERAPQSTRHPSTPVGGGHKKKRNCHTTASHDGRQLQLLR